MKKLIIFLGIFLFADTKLISQKIEKDNIIANFKVDEKSFKQLKSVNKKDLNAIAKDIVCKNSILKKLNDSYNIIYNYKTDNDSVKVEITKGSCNIH